MVVGSFADSRWAYAIMNCPLCVIVGIIIGIIVIICGWSSCPQVWSQKLYILHTYAHMPLVYGHEFVSEYKLYILNGSHFSSFLYVALLTTWLSLEPSYSAQLWTCTGVLYSQKIMQLWTIFLKKNILKDFHILHFFPNAQHALRYTVQCILFVLLVFMCY